MDPASLLTVAVSLFFILDPFASLPVFMSVTKGLDGDTVRSYADRAALVAAVLLVVFIFAGPYLMDVFGITMDSFRVAGGIMLLLMAVDLVFDLSQSKKSESGAPWVIVATPILTGQGVITQAILLTDSYDILTVAVAGLAALGVTWLILRCSERIMKAVGTDAIGILSRVIGLLIAAMGIEYIFVGTFNWIDAHELIGGILTS